MKCGFCGYEFDERDVESGCRDCPMARGCRKIKCPRCNYENPPEPEIVKKLKKILRRR